jgi:DNA-binding CsgD family transcriptional regulator
MQINLEQLSTLIGAIHAAAAFPERQPELLSAMERLVTSSLEGRRASFPSIEKILRFDAGEDDPRAYQGAEPSLKRVMELLAPHFRAARQVQMRLADAQAGRLALASLDHIAVAAVILNRDGAVHYLNASARSLIADDGCIHIRNARLRFNEPALNVALEVAVRRATQTPPGSSLLPLSSASKEVYEVTVSPLEAGREEATPAAGAPLALVVIARPRPDPQRIVQRARRLYGLTDAEARVMAALTMGETVEGIASAHGVRTSTVRAQVRSIFEKTGVNRQSDLVRLALTGAPLISGPDN